MIRISLLLAILFLQAGSPPRQQTPAGQVPAEERASIQGFVVKMGTGEPVAKASVVLSPFNGGRNQGALTATTGTDGQFVFRNLEPGPYRLSATRSGYVRMEYGARTPNRSGLPINLAPLQRLTQLVMQLMPAGTITGRVFDRDGEPLANVTVEALKYSYQEGHRTFNGVQTARTNDLGEYRLFWLQPGQYFVSATYDGGPGRGEAAARSLVQTAIVDAIASRGGGGRGGAVIALGQRQGGPAGPDSEEGYVPVYYPSTTDAQSAAPINLGPGVVFSGVDLTVASVRTVRVRGQVINGVTGQPARNANISLVPIARRVAGGFRGEIRNIANFRNRINEQGEFEIGGVVPGSYDLIGILNDRNNRMSARVPLEIGSSDVQNVTLVISPGFSLTGRLAIEGQSATGNAEVGRMRVMLRPDSAAQIAGAPPAAPVQADGTFAIQQVGRDDYRLTVTGMPRNGYLKMARLGATDVLNEGLQLDRAPTGALEILVSTNTGIADGIVQNEKQEPYANVTVVLIPDPARRHRLDLYRTTATDAMGRFHVEGIPPGDYKVFAWEDVEMGAWQDPDFIRQFEDRGRAIRMTEGGTSNIELRVIPPQV